jgi:hypothetical protein
MDDVIVAVQDWRRRLVDLVLGEEEEVADGRKVLLMFTVRAR